MQVRMGIINYFILSGSNQKKKHLIFHYEVIVLIISTSFPNAKLDQIILPAILTHKPELSLQFQSGLTKGLTAFECPGLCSNFSILTSMAPLENPIALGPLINDLASGNHLTGVQVYLYLRKPGKPGFFSICMKELEKWNDTEVFLCPF